jgi:hypothetical protein
VRLEIFTTLKTAAQQGMIVLLCLEEGGSLFLWKCLHSLTWARSIIAVWRLCHLLSHSSLSCVCIYIYICMACPLPDVPVRICRNRNEQEQTANKKTDTWISSVRNNRQQTVSGQNYWVFRLCSDCRTHPFRRWICSHHQLRAGDTPTVLGPLERSELDLLNHMPSSF